MKSRHSYMLFTASLIVLAQSGNANAQTRDVPQADSGSSIEDIVVTARRREETQQSVPQTISTVTAADIERKSLRSTEDLARVVPGINISGQRRDEAQFFIRGQGPGPITTGQRNFSSVATYFAEVPAAVSGPGTFFDLQNVQVLKGPQGTLFGRNTTGGAVLFEPHHPEYENNGYVKLTGGNYAYKEFEGVLNVAPVPGMVALRIAAQVSRRNGYTISAAGQDLDERNYEALRASLRLNPTDRIESLTIVDYRAKDNNSGSSVLRAINPDLVLSAPVAGVPVRLGGIVNIGCLRAALPGCPAGGAAGAIGTALNGGNTASATNSGFYLLAPTSVLQSTLAQQQALGIRRNLVTDLLRSKSLDIGITNKTSIDITDNIKIKNIIAYRRTRKNEAIDYDGTPIPIINNIYASQPWATGNNQFTEEFQIQGTLSPKLNYILGAYYEKVTTGFDQDVVGYTLGQFNARVSHFRDTSKALFAHVEWDPNELIGFSGGIRQTWDSRFLSFNSFDGTGTCTQADLSAPAGQQAVLCPQNGAAKFNALSYDATVNLKPMQGVLVYGSFRHGYKSGGINLPTPPGPASNPSANLTFGPESVNSYEIGLKGDWNIGVPLRTNLSLFYDKYTHMQVSISTVVPGILQPTNVVRSDVEATNKGAEFEATIVPVKSLNLTGFVSYLKAAADRTYLDALGIPVVVEGRQFAFQPKWTYGVSGLYTLPTSEDLGRMSLSVSYSWRDKVFNANSPALSILPVYDAYGLLNARFDWNNIVGKGVDLGIFANNITNKAYIQGGYPIAQLGFDAATYGEPRMYGASLTVHFGSR